MHGTGQDDGGDIASIADPVDRVLRLRARIKLRGTLNAADSALYRSTLAELRGDKERRRGWLAALLGITPGGVDRLLRAKTKTETAA